MKEKVCKGCGRAFLPRQSLASKFCSPYCQWKTKKATAPAQQRIRNVIKDKACKACKMMFSPKTSLAQFCSPICAKSTERPKALVQRKPIRTTQLPKARKPMKRFSARAKLHSRACIAYREAFNAKHGKEFCEVCGVDRAFSFEVHHLYYASKFPRHPSLHHPKNLIMVCKDCHGKFHAGQYKLKFAEIERTRGLKELFEKRVPSELYKMAKR